MEKFSPPRNIKDGFKTVPSRLPFKFRWTVERFTLISSSATVKTPNFCCFQKRNRLAISCDVIWHAVMERDHSSSCICFKLVPKELEEDDNNTWITARLLDENDRIVRPSLQWKNDDFSFNFDYESKGEISLYCLPSDILVIEWEMIRIKPEKHFSTTRDLKEK